MSDCSKCNRTDIKCCHTCKKDANNCNVWHNCGSDCPEYEAKATTNADRIRSMTDEELAKLITSGELSAICPMCDFYGKDLCYIENNNEEKNCSKGILNWLQSEVEGE